MIKPWKTAGIAVVAISLVLAGTLTVAAENPTDQEARPSAPTEGKGGPMRGARGSQSGIVSEAVAEALGMTVDELETQLRDGVTLADLAEEKDVELQALRDLANSAKKDALLERISEALDESSISEELATWYQEGVEEGYMAGSRPKSDDTRYAAAAEALDMTAEEVELQMWAGRTLADLAERADVELEDVEAAIQAARAEAQQERIEQAVKDGEMTQEQADWLLEGIENGYGAASRSGLRGLSFAPLGGGSDGEGHSR